MGEATRAEAKSSEAKKENVASQKQKTDLSQSIGSPQEQILFLQRTIGNKAVGRLIKSRALQAKLKIGHPGDIYEQEAEERVSNSTHKVSRELESSISAVRGGGQPLPESVRAYMEPRFGVDFSQVRVHTGSGAIQMNRDIGAKAFTHGTDIYFGASQSPTNLELTAHELTHVVQQTGGSAVLMQGAPAVQRQPKETASESGKRMYRTSDGKMVELPPDMTAEDAARLEAEAKAAEKKLGKRPPPKPLPDVKKPASKEEKKEKPRPEVKVKKGGKGKVKAAPRAGGAATALLEAVGHSEVAKYLAERGAPVLIKGMGRLQELKQNEQTHDNATEKLKQSEKAVVIPPSEEQSQSNALQVNVISAKPTPTVDENKAKQKLQESLIENIPQTIEDVDNFKSDKKAQHMGADVMKVVQGDKNAVISTFADMEVTPPPIPPEHRPEALPPEEVAPPTASMNLGQGAVAPLQKEHTDLSNYTREADSKLKEEDITQEQLDMVDSGDLAEANKEKKGMEKTAKSEPLAVQKFAQQESENVDKDLKQEEKKEREGLKVKRKAGLSATSQQQKGAKTAIEKQREEVANKINAKFKSAQDKVKKKLADLETASMKRFDDGNAKATKEFEDNVKREIDAYKEERYSGFWGWARKAKDWLRGMDHLPRVKAIFDSNRATFVNTINKLVDDINADNKRVIQECKDELANAREEIKKFVDKLGPDLKDIGKKAAEEMNTRLDELDQFVAKKEQELQDKLKDKQQAAIKAIDEKIEKMKEAMAGALSKLGKLLLNAAKKFFTWALEKFGYTLDTIEGIINKGVAVLKAIFTKPIQFVKNLVNAAMTGFKNFGLNFLTHLKDAVFEWLTGSLVGIILPESWDLKGILSVVFQMLGITYQNIRSHLVKLIPEPVVKSIETTFTLVKSLITEGPMAAWEQLKDTAGEMKDTFIDAVKDWIKWKVIEEAIKSVVSMFIPGAGIVRAIVGIYDTIVFFIQKAKDILQMVGNFLGSIAEIAAGNIGAAAEALEHGLARGIKLVIDFLAKFLHLDGITQKIRDVIQNIRSKVEKVIVKVAQWVVAKAKKLWGKLTGKDKEKKPGKDEGDQYRKGRDVGESVPFSAGGVQHQLFIQVSGTNATVMVASAPQPLDATLSEMEGKVSTLAPEAKSKAPSLIGRARSILSKTERKADEVSAARAAPSTANDGTVASANDQVKSDEHVLADTLDELFTLFGGTAGLPFSMPVSMAGVGHTLTVEDDGGHLTVWLASRKEAIHDKFQQVDRILKRWEDYINGIGNDAIKDEFTKKIKPEIEAMKTDELKGALARVEGMKSKQVEELKTEIDTNIKTLASIISDWATRIGVTVKDFSDEAIKAELDRKADEEAEKVWEQKKSETQQKLEQFAGEIQALDPAAKLKYRGSLAKWRKGVTKGFGEFDPLDFDIDFFVESDKLYLEAVGVSMPVQAAEAEVWADLHPALRAMKPAMAKACDTIPGVRIGKFSMKLRAVSNVRWLLSQKGTREYAGETHVEIKPPPPPTPSSVK